jgi:hypothetical protein
MFGESPPVGYGGWTGIGRSSQQTQPQVRQIGEVVQPQPEISSEEQLHLKTEEEETQEEQEFGGFLPSSLPAYHQFSFAQPQTPTTTTTTSTVQSPYAKHVRRTSYDQSFDAASELLGGCQRPHLPKVPESTLVC